MRFLPSRLALRFCGIYGGPAAFILQNAMQIVGDMRWLEALKKKQPPVSVCTCRSDHGELRGTSNRTPRTVDSSRGPKGRRLPRIRTRHRKSEHLFACIFLDGEQKKKKKNVLHCFHRVGLGRFQRAKPTVNKEHMQLIWQRSRPSVPFLSALFVMARLPLNSIFGKYNKSFSSGAGGGVGGRRPYSHDAQAICSSSAGGRAESACFG